MGNREKFLPAEIEQRSAAMHLNEVAGLRYLATSATTQKVRRDLERRALVHDRLTGDLQGLSKVGRAG